MNLLEKEINQTMSRMNESETISFLMEVNKHQPKEVHLNIGRYVESGTLIMLANVDGLKLADTSVKGLLSISEYYKATYLSQEWRQVIKDKLNRCRKIVATA